MARTAAASGEQRPNLRHAQRLSTRRLLVLAASDLFKSQGFAGTSVDDIAKAAGTTRATFYLHFKGKADVIRELVESTSLEAAEFIVRLRAAVRDGHRPAIHAWLDSAFEFWKDARHTSQAEEEAAALHPQIRMARSRSFEAGVDAIIGGLTDAQRADPSDRRVRAVLAYSQLQNLFHRWIRVGWDVERQAVLEVMTDMWMAALGSPSDGIA